MDATFLYKKRFFYDTNTDDPVQLHLLYCQLRDDIVAGIKIILISITKVALGKHPVSGDEAVQFAALQAQIQVGDCKLDIHKPGFLK